MALYGLRSAQIASGNWRTGSMPTFPLVMAGHSRSKNGVASARLCPGHPRLASRRESKTWMPGTRPGMTKRWQRRIPLRTQRVGILDHIGAAAGGSARGEQHEALDGEHLARKI